MNTTSLRFRATTTLAAAITTFAAFAGSIALPSMAHAASDEPWPEPPSCSNETGTCTSIEDMVAYECYFEIDNSPFHFCDDPLAGIQVRKNPGLVAPQAPAPAPAKLVLPTLKR